MNGWVVPNRQCPNCNGYIGRHDRHCITCGSKVKRIKDRNGVVKGFELM